MPSKSELEAIDLYQSFLSIIRGDELTHQDDKYLAKQCASFMADKIFNMQHPSMSTYEHWRDVIDEIKKI